MLRLIGIFQSSQTLVDVWERHSSFGKCQKIMILVLKFIARAGRTLAFSPTCEGSKLTLFRWEQYRNWTYKISTLQAAKELPVQHPWNKFQCIVKEGIVQVQTRTQEPPLILLPDKSHITRLWLKWIHETELRHAGGHRSLLGETRKMCWVIHGISECKRIIWNCVGCKRREPHVRAQLMAPLPDFRTQTRDGLPVAFATVGLDVTGPFETKQGRGRVRHKRCLLYTSPSPRDS